MENEQCDIKNKNQLGDSKMTEFYLKTENLKTQNEKILPDSPQSNLNDSTDLFLLSFLSYLNFNLNSAYKCEYGEEEEKNLLRKASTAEGFEDNMRNYNEDNLINSYSSRDTNEREEEDNSPHNLIIQIIKTDKYKYLGQIKNNKREGFGICYYPRGEVYIGQWKEGKKEGIGKILLPNGDIHQGELKEDLFEGYAEIINLKKLIKINGLAVKGEFIGEINAKIQDKNIEGIDVKYFNNNLINLSNEQFNEENVLNTNNDDLNNKFICKIILNNDQFYYGEIYNNSFPASTTKDNKIENNNDNVFGILVNKKEECIIGEFDNKYLQTNGYCEIYKYNDTQTNQPTMMDLNKFFGFLTKGKKNGFGLEMYNDGKLIFGKYLNDIKIGPFFNMTKTSLCSKMEIYHLGFKSKTVEKQENIKKYLPLNYPEYSYLLYFNYKPILDVLMDLKIDEEMLNY